MASFVFFITFRWPAGSAEAQEAGPRDAQVIKVLTEAMDSDYLETKFDAAERKLRAAIDSCGADSCAPAVKARLYVALGTVLAHGKKQLEDARDVFVEALMLDPGAKLDPDLTSTEISYAFEKARIAAGQSAANAPLQLTPVAEQKLRTPVPLFVEVRQDLLAQTDRLIVWYLAPNAKEYRSLSLKKLRDRAFGINIPCTDLTVEGTLRYYLTALDAQGAILGSAGTRDAPLTTAIKSTITSEPPHWPGFAPPATCAAIEQSKPAQCLDERQCNPGFTCIEGTCTEKKPEPSAKDVRKNWISLGFWPDVSIFSGDDVCTRDGQQQNHFVCLRSDKSRYDGIPTQGVANNVNLGFALSTLRLAVAYDRLLLDNLTVGARVGFAFGGVNDGGASFLPLHLEARGQFYFGRHPFEELGTRLFVLASAGVAQIDTKIGVSVLEDGVACGAADPTNPDSPCTQPGPSGIVENPRNQKLDAYKQAGFGFVSLGGGIAYVPIDGLALNIAVRGSLTLPVVTVVLSPEVSVGLGF